MFQSQTLKICKTWRITPQNDTVFNILLIIVQCERTTYLIQKFNSRDLVKISLVPYNEHQRELSPWRYVNLRKNYRSIITHYNSRETHENIAKKAKTETKCQQKSVQCIPTKMYNCTPLLSMNSLRFWKSCSPLADQRMKSSTVRQCLNQAQIECLEMEC